MKQFFILGRNPKLSEAEIFSYLDARNLQYTKIFNEQNILLLEIPKKINIQELGGTIKSGEILFAENEEKLESFLEQNDLIKENKFTYCVLGNHEKTEELLKNKFKQEKRKSQVRKSGKKIKFQNQKIGELPKTKYTFLSIKSDKVFFGLTTQEYDYENIKKRDMKKPHRRESLAISPRLSKILINLSQAKENETVLDPFCGVGAILIEALVKKNNVIGVDKNKDSIKCARENIRWLKENYQIKNHAKIFDRDSSKLPEIKFHAVATESSLGDIQKKKPSQREAKRILEYVEEVLTKVLKRISQLKKPSVKIAITTPHVSGLSANMQEICKNTKLKIHKIKDIEQPIKESREDQKISRDIWVLE